MIGKKFARLTIMSFSHRVYKPGKTRLYWKCLCECGNEKTVEASNLRGGAVSSCGCLHGDRMREVVRKHGCAGTAIYNIWQKMKNRCYDKNSSDYKNYGGRGISVCDRWRVSFENFQHDMGHRAAGLTVERINNNGNYEPENCRWATRKEQTNNTRRNNFITINGQRKTISEWAFVSGLRSQIISKRLKRGWSGAELLLESLPPGKKKKVEEA